jgi:hypothetical protein
VTVTVATQTQILQYMYVKLYHLLKGLFESSSVTLGSLIQVMSFAAFSQNFTRPRAVGCAPSPLPASGGAWGVVLSQCADSDRCEGKQPVADTLRGTARRMRRLAPVKLFILHPGRREGYTAVLFLMNKEPFPYFIKATVGYCTL